MQVDTDELCSEIPPLGDRQLDRPGADRRYVLVWVGEGVNCARRHSDPGSDVQLISFEDATIASALKQVKRCHGNLMRGRPKVSSATP